MKRFIIFILALFMTGISHSGGDFNKLKCESGVVIDVLGVPKRWHYNDQEVIEIYANGYQRVYDVQSITEDTVLAFENADLGKYYVTISFGEKDIKVSVKTPFASYSDINCKRL